MKEGQGCFMYFSFDIHPRFSFPFDKDGEFEDFDIEPYSVPPELSDMMRAQDESAGAISSD